LALRFRPTVIAAAAFFVTGLVLAFRPLFGVFDYDFAVAVTLAGFVIHGLSAGLSVPTEGFATLGPAGRIRRVTAQGALAPLAALPGAVIGELLNGPCAHATGLYWFFNQAWGSSVVAAALLFAWVWLAGFKTRTVAVIMAGLPVLACAVPIALWLARNPPVFLLHSLAGYFPGPIYDELLRAFGPELLLFRLTGLAWAALALWSLAAARPAQAARRWAAGGALIATTVFATLIDLVAHVPTAARIEAALGGVIEGSAGSGYRLVYPCPAGTDPAECRNPAPTALSPGLALTALEVDFQLERLAQSLGIARAELAPVLVFIYGDPVTKKRLMGAGETQVAKPWLRQVHVSEGLNGPPRVLAHELAHVVLGPYGHGYFGVTAESAWARPNMGLVEGAATALAWDNSGATPHEAAAEMLRTGKLPTARELMDTGAFYALPGPRAYDAAGSLLRFVLDTHGAEKFRALYRAGDFDGVLGAPLEKVETDWHAMLKTIDVPETARRMAEHRIRQKSIFEQRCARHVARRMHAFSHAAGVMAEADWLSAGNATAASDKIARAMDDTSDAALEALLDRAGRDPAVCSDFVETFDAHRAPFTRVRRWYDTLAGLLAADPETAANGPTAENRASLVRARLREAAPLTADEAAQLTEQLKRAQAEAETGHASTRRLIAILTGALDTPAWRAYIAARSQPDRQRALEAHVQQTNDAVALLLLGQLESQDPIQGPLGLSKIREALASGALDADFRELGYRVLAREALRAGDVAACRLAWQSVALTAASRPGDTGRGRALQGETRMAFDRCAFAAAVKARHKP
jgi:hypothetical protein